MELVTTKRTNGDETPGAILRAGTSSGKAAKNTAIFKPCENSEETAVFVPLSISFSDAPDSERRTPFRVRFHRTAKSHAEQQKR